MKELRVHLEFGFTPNLFRWGLATALLTVSAAELGSESVTLTTYYPAPSGVYNQMITTGNTWLARDGGTLSVGTSLTPGGGAKVIVMGGGMGIGTTSPSAFFEVYGGGGMMISQPGGNGDLQMNSATRPTIYPSGGLTPANLDFQIRSKGTGVMQINTDNNGDVRIAQGGGLVILAGHAAGRVGIGPVFSPVTALDAEGTITARPKAGFACGDAGHDYPDGSSGGQLTSDLWNSGACPLGSNRYVTTIDGFMAKKYILSNSENPDFKARCCYCEGGNCPGL